MKERIELMPGVNLTAITLDKFKTGCFSVNFLRPLCRKEAAKNALFSSVLLRGSEQYPDMQSLSMAMDELYGTEIGLLIRKKGEVQTVGLYADFVEDECLENEKVFSGAAELMGQVLLHPVLSDGGFRTDYVEREKENLIHSIRSRINSKRSYAVYRMSQIMFRGEAYSTPRLGEEEDVTPITAQNLYAHYREILATSRVEICYIGRKSPQEAAEVFRRMLRGLPRETCVPASTVFVPRAEQVRTETESLRVTQGKLCMGFRTGVCGTDDDWRATQVMNAVFGGGVTSKLFVNVREKLSLCYYASSSLENHKGVMLVSSGIEFGDFEKARDAVLHELEQCREGNVTQEELENAKKHLISVYRTAKDSPSQLDDFYLGQAVSQTHCTMDDVIACVERVTAEDVARAARRVSLDTVYFLKGAEA